MLGWKHSVDVKTEVEMKQTTTVKNKPAVWQKRLVVNMKVADVKLHVCTYETRLYSPA